MLLRDVPLRLWWLLLRWRIMLRTLRRRRLCHSLQPSHGHLLAKRLRLWPLWQRPCPSGLQSLHGRLRAVGLPPKTLDRDIERRAEMYGLKANVPAPYPLKEFDLANRLALLGLGLNTRITRTEMIVPLIGLVI